MTKPADIDPYADAEPIQAGVFMTAPGLSHAFFSRRGGAPTGSDLYRGLNCGLGSSDDPERVLANRAIAAGRLGVAPERIFTGRQVHGTAVVGTEAFIAGARPEADAVVSDRPGDAAGAMAADCGPVLFADAEAQVAAAAHAGWRGALDGILEATVQAMEARGARSNRIAAALGPTIGPLSYEVGAEFEARFLAADRDNEQFFAPGATPDKRMFDLPGYIIARLTGIGVAADWVGMDTLAAPDRFFSARHSGRIGAKDYGRMLSAIALLDAD
ncbi:MAG: polyphenol oxidase family protein [Pseudomonadota bacterium]